MRDQVTRRTALPALHSTGIAWTHVTEPKPNSFCFYSESKLSLKDW